VSGFSPKQSSLITQTLGSLMHLGIAAVAEIVITGQLVLIGCGLVAVSCALVAVGSRLVSVGHRLILISKVLRVGRISAPRTGELAVCHVSTSRQTGETQRACALDESHSIRSRVRTR
jgi:hypothetical protein